MQWNVGDKARIIASANRFEHHLAVGEVITIVDVESWGSFIVENGQSVGIDDAQFPYRQVVSKDDIGPLAE